MNRDTSSYEMNLSMSSIVPKYRTHLQEGTHNTQTKKHTDKQTAREIKTLIDTQKERHRER